MLDVAECVLIAGTSSKGSIVKEIVGRFCVVIVFRRVVATPFFCLTDVHSSDAARLLR